MEALLPITVLLVLVVVFAVLTRRAWRARSPLVRWPGVVLSGLLTVLLALVAGLAALGYARLNLSASNPVRPISAARAADAGSHGARLVYVCAHCHAADGQPPLSGGTSNFADIPNLPSLGTIVPPNLTPAGPLKDWTDGEIIRAIREGVRNDGRPLLAMPTQDFHELSDGDVQAIVAYLRSQSAVPHDTPPRSINALGAIGLGLGMFQTSVQPPLSGPVAGPAIGSTAEYGAYLVRFAGCRACHGDDLTGGTSPYSPAGPNLRVLVASWSSEQFAGTIRTGVDPAGHHLSDLMPWKDFGQAFSDQDLAAIYTFIRR